MKRSIALLLLMASTLIITACAQQPDPIGKDFVIPEDALRLQNHPTCDPHQYIYGCDKGRRWQSNGCSRQYIGTCAEDEEVLIGPAYGN